MKEMTGREIITRIIKHDAPPRFGFDFIGDNPCDFIHCAAGRLVNPKYDRYGQWGRDEAVKRLVPNFSGEVRMTAFGDVYGRFDGKTKGECIRGALQDGWEALDELEFPTLDPTFEQELAALDLAHSDKFALAYLPLAIFSPLRDTRHMENALMDLLLEPENVERFLDKVVELDIQAVRSAAKHGVNGVIIYDDMGMQHALFFSPKCFRELLKPFYRKLAEAVHDAGMYFFVHSCGLVYDIIDDLIDAGVDVLQFDQSELSGSRVLAENFGDRVTIYSPVDIQKIMPTNDPAVIERGAREMAENFRRAGGSFIAMDYGNWPDLGVSPEMQQLARDVLIANSML